MTSKAGLAAAIASGATGVPLKCVTSSSERCSMGIESPEASVRSKVETGAAIPIELRADEEITVPAAPAGTKALNYAFDVTPAELVTAVVTERRLIPNGQWLTHPEP